MRSPSCAAPPALGELKAPLGVYGCLGNHDHYANTEQLVGRLRTTAMDLLVNEHRTLNIDGGKLHIIGTDNTGFSQRYADLPRAVAGIDPEEENVQILLAHDPTFWDSHVRPNLSGIDVMLCAQRMAASSGSSTAPSAGASRRCATSAGQDSMPSRGRRKVGRRSCT